MAEPHSFTHRGAHRLPVGRERAWELLQQTDRYPKWWPWMRKLEVGGTPLDPGTAFRFQVVAPIPFTMRLEVEIVESIEAELIEATVAGDLAGIAEMSFKDTGTEETEVTLSWTVEVRKAGVRRAARAFRPILKWGQNWAVDAALKGFLRDLERR